MARLRVAKCWVVHDAVNLIQIWKMSRIVRNQSGKFKSCAPVELQDLNESGLVLVQSRQRQLTLKPNKLPEVRTRSFCDRNIVPLRIHLQERSTELVLELQLWKH